MAPLNIIVVGGSIAGSAVAIGLARNGHHVTIYERSATGQEVGYAFRITANSDRCLKHLGIDTIAGGAVAANTNRIYNTRGEVMMETKENTDPEKAKEAVSVFASRPALSKQLIDAALETGRVELKAGEKITDVDVEKTSVTLASGEKVAADLIIAADGVHSVIRPHIIDSSKYYPVACNQNVFRFMLPRDVAQNDPLLSSVVQDDVSLFGWREGNIAILVYPVDHGKTLNVTMGHPSHLSDKEIEKDEDGATDTSYNQKASFETIRDIHKGWEPRAIRLLELADPNGFRIWKLMDMDQIPTCSRNHTVLIGDACHPVLPHGFSGASMAIEDAVTLSAFLEKDVKMKELPGLLKLYEDVRNPRVAGVRDAARKRLNGMPPKEELERYRDFLQNHDAVKYAQERLAEYKKN